MEVPATAMSTFCIEAGLRQVPVQNIALISLAKFIQRLNLLFVQKAVAFLPVLQSCIDLDIIAQRPHVRMTSARVTSVTKDS